MTTVARTDCLIPSDTRTRQPSRQLIALYFHKARHSIDHGGDNASSRHATPIPPLLATRLTRLLYKHFNWPFLRALANIFLNQTLKMGQVPLRHSSSTLRRPNRLLAPHRH